MHAKTKAILNLLAVAVLGLFLWWADDNLDGYQIQILNLIAVNIILALSLNLIYGFTGLFSLGHAGFMAVGAYVCSVLILAPEQKEMLFILEPAFSWVREAQAPFFVAVVAGGLLPWTPLTLVWLRLSGNGCSSVWTTRRTRSC